MTTIYVDRCNPNAEAFRTKQASSFEDEPQMAKHSNKYNSLGKVTINGGLIRFAGRYEMLWEHVVR